MVALLSLSDELTDRLLRTRTIVLGEVVDEQVANLLIAQLHLLEEENPDADVRMLLQSPGGALFAGLAIYDAMQFITCDVVTIATGITASMAQILLCSGAPGKRFALPHASIMMHQGSAGVGGVAADVEIQAENLERMERMVNEILARHTGQSPETIAADGDRDRWFTAAQAAEYGMVDHVVSDRPEMEAMLKLTASTGTSGGVR